MPRFSLAAVAALTALLLGAVGVGVAEPHAQSKSRLRDARDAFRTTVTVVDRKATAPPVPPRGVFELVEYTNPQGARLPAYVTPDPKDGRKRAAIVWIVGGDVNSLGEVWTPRPESNDQSARAYRDAGLVMMFAGLRGGNGRGGAKELFLGEVDDVLAAADYLARLPHVDASRIYLGGHSTGGTLALLVAETSARFRAVFAFGPASSAASYDAALLGVDLMKVSETERRLRTPYFWLEEIATPTFIIEGIAPGSNIDSFRGLCAKTRNPQVRCVGVTGKDHFSVLAPLNRAIATALAQGGPPHDGIARVSEAIARVAPGAELARPLR